MGAPYLERFPLLTPLDLMRLQRLFVHELGIERLHLVVGPSMGGMIAWEWAIEGGEDVRPGGGGRRALRSTAHQIGLNWLQRRGVELDLSGDRGAAGLGTDGVARHRHAQLPLAGRPRTSASGASGSRRRRHPG